jgi:hypothetical protein
VQYIKSAQVSSVKKRRKFKALFTNGMESNSVDTATFFYMMQEKKVTPDEVFDYIGIGQEVDPGKPWKEIATIAQAFQKNATQAT